MPTKSRLEAVFVTRLNFFLLIFISRVAAEHPQVQSRGQVRAHAPDCDERLRVDEDDRQGGPHGLHAVLRQGVPGTIRGPLDPL